MNSELHSALLNCETDVDGALNRFYGDETLYLSLLDAFLSEPTMDKLNHAVDDREWEDAFISAHALKGLAANMGFIPLYHALGELILMLRAENYEDAAQKYLTVKECYYYVIYAIRQNKAG